MNKFVLNFSDFILNENNRVNKTLNNTLLYEDQEVFSTATTEEIIKDRLRTKLQSVCVNSTDADMIVGKSKDLIDAAVKVYNKEPSSNFFKENIGYILTAGAVLVGAYIASKKGKKIKLGNTLTKIIDGIKKKLEDPIIKILQSKLPSVENHYKVLEKNCNSVLKYIKNIENKSYYNNLNTNGKNFFLNIEKIIVEFQTNFKGQYKYFNSEELTKKTNLKERLNEIKNAIIEHKTIIQDKIEGLKLQNIDDLVKTKPVQADSKIITIPDYSSNKITPNEISEDIKKIINKYENFLKELEQINLEFDDILITTGINKPSERTLIDVVQEGVAASGKQIKNTPPPSKFIERIKKYGITTGVTVGSIGSIYLIYNNWSEISEWFKDTPELGPTIDIINNTGQAKEYYVQQMKDALPTFTYDNWFSGLNVGNVTFKSDYQYYSDNLKGAILYDLAHIIINELKTFASISMYGILEKTTQA